MGRAIRETQFPEGAARLIGLLKGAFIAVFVPIHFAITSGHVRAAFARKGVDYAGRPVIWVSFPAIDFLSGVDFGDSDVLEFGAGNSTIWWAQRARSVLAVEGIPEWYEDVKAQLAGYDNVELVLVRGDEEYIDYPRTTGRKFDVVVVDGEHRARTAATALDVVKEDGVILVDDSEGNWGRPPTYPIIDLLQGAGLNRVDFHGYAPGVRRPHTTSLFFRDGARIFKNLRPPVKHYVA